MQIDCETLGNGIIKVNLSGRMDILGPQDIDLTFTKLTATPKALILVDMSEVSFLASLGMRILLSSAKALSNCGGKMAIYMPQATVLDVLEASGVSSLISVYEDLEEAMDALAVGHDKG
jgi:anti-anti-sigma factor